MSTAEMATSRLEQAEGNPTPHHSSDCLAHTTRRRPTSQQATASRSLARSTRTSRSKSSAPSTWARAWVSHQPSFPSSLALVDRGEVRWSRQESQDCPHPSLAGPPSSSMDNNPMEVWSPDDLSRLQPRQLGRRDLTPAPESLRLRLGLRNFPSNLSATQQQNKTNQQAIALTSPLPLHH